MENFLIYLPVIKGKYKSMSNIRFSSGICIRQSLDHCYNQAPRGNEHLNKRKREITVREK